MSRMMRSMMSDPFFLDPFGTMNQAMVGFGTTFPSFDQQIQSALSNPSAYSYCSSSVTSYSLDPSTGRPHVYQAHSSTSNLGGVRETRESVRDSRSGLEKMAIGHHIDERGHVIARERNAYTGQQEQTEDFINIEETEAEKFNREWRQRAAAGYYNAHNSHHHHQPAIQEISDSEYQNYQDRQPRALPAPPPAPTASASSSSSSHRSHRRAPTHTTTAARAHNAESPTPIVTLADDDDTNETNVDNNSNPTSPASHGTRRGCDSPSTANRRKKYKEKKSKSKPYAKK